VLANTLKTTMDLLDPPILAAAIGAVMLMLITLRRQGRTAKPSAPPRDDSLDTIDAWPPQVVRVMTLGERQAYEVLRRALPGHVILAQVPLSRFISVPTRHAYNLWLQRAGRLAVDLLVCDYSTRAVAAIEVRTAEESERGARRHRRLVEVLRAAGIDVHEWDEDKLPSITEARSLFLPREAPHEAAAERVDAGGRTLIPVPDIHEVLSEGDQADYGQLEPVPSAFYDEAEDARSVRQAA
jgi:hypothetical protein